MKLPSRGLKCVINTEITTAVFRTNNGRTNYSGYKRNGLFVRLIAFFRQGKLIFAALHLITIGENLRLAISAQKVTRKCE